MDEIKHMGVGDWFYVILQNILICLKLLECIDYSWWKVFVPSFIVIGISILWMIIQGMLDTLVRVEGPDDQK